MIRAEIVADSVSFAGSRITTFVLTYPRFIHAEFMTHRMFSRNASSSRAIPVKKQIQMVIDNPAIPLAFTKNQKGMQGGAALDGEAHTLAVKAWLDARDSAVRQAQILSDLEVHKQYANRVLEPFSHITVICTATEFANFFALRIHEAAQPEIKELAEKMYKAYSESQPTQLMTGQWHLPFVDKPYASTNDIKQSVARCARVSYLNHDGSETTLEQDLQLYDRLLGALPIHASPAEHQAWACQCKSEWYGNFQGWVQYRKTLKDENISTYGDESK